MVDDIVKASEMIHRLNDIIHINNPVANADSVRLKDMARLVMSQAAPFDMIGVIGQVNLRTMIDASFQP